MSGVDVPALLHDVVLCDMWMSRLCYVMWSRMRCWTSQVCEVMWPHVGCGRPSSVT